MKRAGSKPIKMPGLSDTMEIGHLVRWLKKPGDRINKGDILAEIESDKSAMDMEAFDEGYLIGPLAEEDSDIGVGEVMAYLGQAPEPDEHSGDKYSNQDRVIEIERTESKIAESSVQKNKLESQPKPQSDAQPAAFNSQSETAEKQKPVVSTSHHSQLKASPYARGLAKELGIDLAHVQAGAGGVIKSPQVIAAAMQGAQANLNAGPAWRYKLFTPMHRAIANNMIASSSTPTFSVSIQLPTDDLTQVAHNKQLSLTLILARALALSVEKHPDFNAAYTPQGLALRKQIDVGIAVDIPGGLITPVLRDMSQRPMQELVDNWRQLKRKIKSTGLQPQEYQGATIYLSNLGMFEGISRFDAIVPVGACAILAVAASQNGLAELTLSVDHRVVYGAEAARFMQTLKSLLHDADNL